MSSDRCPICGGWLFKSEIWGKPHRCPPAWLCWISDTSYGYEREDAKTIYSDEPIDAAKEFVVLWDAEGDYICVGGDRIRVSVESVLHPGQVRVFLVRGEMVPEYWAEQVDTYKEAMPFQEEE